VAKVEYIEGCYEVQDVEFGKVYKWHPESILIKCGCGENLTLTSSQTTCVWCGADYASIIREELATWRPEDETTHPWHYAEDREEAMLPC
jgi:hypothetical protein